MATVTIREMTVEEFQALPSDGRSIEELVAGYVVSEPLPSTRHGRVAMSIAALLHAYVRSKRLGVVVGGDSGFVLARNPDTLRGPDVAFIVRERHEALEDEGKVFPGAPDLAVEVLSPSNTPQAVHAKVADYLAAGTPLVWVVDTEAECVRVYETLLAPRTLKRGDTLTGDDVVAGFEVALDEIFDLY